MGQRLDNILKMLKRRKVLQNSFYYCIGAVGLLASIYQISESNKIRTLFSIICITGLPIVMISSFFHRIRGKNPIPAVEIILISICAITGAGLAVKTVMTPTPITILIRMMAPQETWFVENILKPFERENHCRVKIRRFEKDYELCDILKREAVEKKIKNVSLAKIPLHLTLLLFKSGLVKSHEDILRDIEISKSEIQRRLHAIEKEYDPNALEMGRFCSITKKELYYLPRKLETRLMVYRKSKVMDAVKNWHKMKPQLNEVLKEENGYGLPRNYDLESDPNKWNFYDLFVVGYYWINTAYDGRRSARMAHRSENYAGTALGLIDRALELGALKGSILDFYRFSEPIIDLLQWEAVFRKFDLYCNGMWDDDGWSGSDIYEGIKKQDVYLTWMHQLDCLLIYGSEKLGIKGYLDQKEDLGVSIMPQGVSFELTESGLPKRTGTRKAHTFAWFWGIPKNSPEPELAYKLALFMTDDKRQLEESKNFWLISTKAQVSEALKADLGSGWQAEVHAKSVEQLRLNADHLVPRFKTLVEYREFLDRCYDAFEQIVIKKRYSLEGPEGKVDRDFIRENIK